MGSSTPYSSSTTNAEDRMRNIAGNVADKAADMADMASEQLDRAADTAQSLARRGVETGREAGERVGQVADNMKTAVVKSLDEQPLTTLAVAAAVGFVLGALWKS